MLLKLHSPAPARTPRERHGRGGSLAFARRTTMGAPRCFDRIHRLRTALEYGAVKAHSTGFRGNHCLLLALAKPGEMSRLGIITSKKGVGGAVERNRARRRLREIVRLRWPRVPKTGFWLVLIAYRTSVTAEHQDLANDVEHLLAAAGALAPIQEPVV